MRNVIAVMVLILTVSLAGVAQDVPKAQVFGGVSWLHIDDMNATAVTGISVKKNYWGWVAAPQYNFNKWLGAKADISGHYGTPVTGGPSGSSYSFLFGPQFSIRGEHATPFVHTLFGINRIAAGSTSDSAYAMALGGGIDVKVNDRFAVRLGQLDWLYTRHNFTSAGLKDHQGNIRYAGGIVINFGK